MLTRAEVNGHISNFFPLHFFHITFFFLKFLDFETHGKELTREQYTIGLHYFDVMMGLKDTDARLSPSLTKQKLQITRKSVEEKELALSIQKFYMRLLNRYLASKHGHLESKRLLEKYNHALLQLREMRGIILEKSLQF